MYPVSSRSRSSSTSDTSAWRMRSSTGSSPGGTRRSTTLRIAAPRMPGLAIASFTLHAPRSTANVRVAISVFPQEHPRAFRHGLLSRVLREHLRVPHAGDRRTDRRKHRLAIVVDLLASDLAVRLDAIRPERPGHRDRPELLRIELEPELVGVDVAAEPILGEGDDLVAPP